MGGTGSGREASTPASWTWYYTYRLASVEAIVIISLYPFKSPRKPSIDCPVSRDGRKTIESVGEKSGIYVSRLMIFMAGLYG